MERRLTIHGYSGRARANTRVPAIAVPMAGGRSSRHGMTWPRGASICRARPAGKPGRPGRHAIVETLADRMLRQVDGAPGTTHSDNPIQIGTLSRNFRDRLACGQHTEIFPIQCRGRRPRRLPPPRARDAIDAIAGRTPDRDCRGARQAPARPVSRAQPATAGVAPPGRLFEGDYRADLENRVVAQLADEPRVAGQRTGRGGERRAAGADRRNRLHRQYRTDGARQCGAARPHRLRRACAESRPRRRAAARSGARAGWRRTGRRA